MLSCVSRGGELSPKMEQAPRTHALRIAIHLMIYSPAAAGLMNRYGQLRRRDASLNSFLPRWAIFLSYGQTLVRSPLRARSPFCYSSSNNRPDESTMSDQSTHLARG